MYVIQSTYFQFVLATVNVTLFKIMFFNLLYYLYTCT